MPIVRWSFLVVGAALSLQFSCGIATRTVVVGSREGRWVYPYLHGFGWRPVVIWAVALAGMLLLYRLTESMLRKRPWLWLFVWLVAALVVEALICSLAPYRFDRIFASDGANSFHSVAARYTPAAMLGDFEAVRKYWPLHAYTNMPGKSILVYWLRRISRDPAVLAWLVVAISNLGALFLYGIARDCSTGKRLLTQPCSTS
jgi:hypothetical protein